MYLLAVLMVPLVFMLTQTIAFALPTVLTSPNHFLAFLRLTWVLIAGLVSFHFGRRFLHALPTASQGWQFWITTTVSLPLAVGLIMHGYAGAALCILVLAIASLLTDDASFKRKT
jgi:hypothetical protein